MKYQADINLLEGIEAKPPRREVLVIFNTMIRNMAREHCGVGQSQAGNDGAQIEGGRGQDEEGQDRERHGGEGYGREGHSREGYGRERHVGDGHGSEGLDGEDQNEGDLDRAGQNSTLDNSQYGLDESGDQGNSTQLSEVERVERGRAAEEREKKKKRKRSMKEEGIEDKKIPIDILRRLAPLWVKHNISTRAAAEITAGFYRECDVDMDDVILSPATAQRSKVEESVLIKEKVLEDLRVKVEEENIKLTLHYDTKLLKQRMLGKRSHLERLALVVSAPELDRPHLLCIPGLQGGTAREQAEAANDVICQCGLAPFIRTLVFDTTATNTGPHGGTVRLIQLLQDRIMLACECRRLVFYLGFY